MGCTSSGDKKPQVKGKEVKLKRGGERGVEGRTSKHQNLLQLVFGFSEDNGVECLYVPPPLEIWKCNAVRKKK